MKPRTCDRCRFWDPIEDDPERGLCRVSRPVRTSEDSVIGEWLQTYCDDWCGEHRERNK